MPQYISRQLLLRCSFAIAGFSAIGTIFSIVGFYYWHGIFYQSLPWLLMVLFATIFADRVLFNTASFLQLFAVAYLTSFVILLATNLYLALFVGNVHQLTHAWYDDLFVYLFLSVVYAVVIAYLVGKFDKLP
jgi:hypothetical protein